MQNRKSIIIGENPELILERVRVFRLWSYTTLNMKIHEKDPIFKKANQSSWSRFKFKVNFSYKILFHKKFLLKENGLIAGALALEEKKVSIFVYAVGLLSQFRRKGYGTKLMEFAEEFAKLKEKRFVNFSVLLANEPAIKMYEKIGYKPQGLGLTLVRCFKNKLDEHIPILKTEIQDELFLRRMKNPSEIDSRAIYWWKEEIKALSIEGKYLTEQERLLDFESKEGWNGFEILHKGEMIGMIAVLPFAFFPTFVLFSNPDKTWNMQWTALLMDYLEKSFTLENINRNPIFVNLKNYRTLKASIFQMFLTHQHRNALKKEESIYKDVFVEDTIEDRQIYFKKLKY
ncbi:MAG: GNAT family N-acetyltransferase [Candidatus Thorarchaeota archaeon]